MVPSLFIVVGLLRRGGAERQVVELVRAAHPEHARVTVVCLVEPGELADEVRATGARVVSLDIGFPAYHRSLARAVRLLRRERPDAIYALLYHPYVYSFPLARLVHPTAARVAGRRATPEFDIAKPPGSRYARLVADRLSDAVIVNSEALRDAWIAENPRLAGRMSVVPNGVRVPEVDPAPRPPSGQMRIVCVGTLAKNKGQAVLIDALALIAEHDDWVLDLVGDGPERAALREQATARGLADRVTLHGGLPSPEVHALLRSADLAVLPSYTEGLPNAVMEAMAHGVPVVATDAGDTRKLLDGGAGTIVPIGDPTALADGIRAMLDDPTRRRAAGEIGRAAVAERYGVDAMRDATLRVISSAIQKRR